MKKIIAILLAGLILSPSYASASVNLSENLLNDCDFITNFTTSVNGVPSTTLPNHSLVNNNWNIEQSNSKYALNSSTYYVNGNSVVYYDNSKQVGINPTDHDLYLNINGTNEY
ncbi:MAG: hypothetical protein K0R05_4815, partial [Anaerocolumna sp.]|nr:hypothetical protein [Anaerocolumna sp.]